MQKLYSDAEDTWTPAFVKLIKVDILQNFCRREGNQPRDDCMRQLLQACGMAKA